MLISFLCLFQVFVGLAVADTPANCTYEDIRGTWTFYVGRGGYDRTLDCTKLGDVSVKTTIELQYPDVAVDRVGNEGFWTLVYNQGFEVVIHGRKFFAFSKYKKDGPNVTSFCDKTMVGWSHDVLGHDWACYEGEKMTEVMPKVHQVQLKPSLLQQKLYQPDHNLIEKINSVQSSWRAGYYDEYESMTVEELIRREGGRKSKMYSRISPGPVRGEIKRLANALPKNFDWRNIGGVSYVSPVRNQEACGSCYAFASMEMNEARLRIMTNDSIQMTFSPQDIIECSQYSQGCDGGFAYLVAGKYGEDFGLVEEQYNTYKGKDGPCSTDPQCPRHYTTKYQYVGGYAGGCNAEQMQLNLMKDGPMAVSFEVYPDFQHYQGGIYHHTGLEDRFNPFELTNHAVLLVGYGEDAGSGEKFWTIKNSWGESWGEQGYFRIRRGKDECAVESLAIESFPIF